MAIPFTCTCVLDAALLQQLNTNTNGCVCPGDILAYQCTVMGGSGGATVWIGTALDCPSEEIILLHQHFTESGGTIRSCNNSETTVPQSPYVQDDFYTSQLNVTIELDIAGKTVICVYDSMDNYTTWVSMQISGTSHWLLHCLN